ncbi:FAD-dependent oxidoreductase [Deltaproteobacteria bacterium]|nr:FAD-dependent oxidoreductase [Deltaproteobacteria bacterium]
MTQQPVRASNPENFPAEVDVAIIGAGPAGTSAAALLHDRGWRTCIVERETFPRFVIGESLLARCMDLLDEAGLLDAVKARDYFVKRGALFVRGGEQADIDFADQFTPGWTWTWQVPRADFDLTLANAVVDRGVPLFYGHEVTAVTTAPTPSLRVHGPSGEHTLRARHIIDASGYGRVLPRLLGLDRPSSLPERKSLFAHVRHDARPEGALANRIWVVLHPKGAWVWLIPLSDGITSVGLVAEPSFFANWPGTDEEIFRAALLEEPNCRARLADMELVFAPRALQGYSAAVSQLCGPGFTLVGNATEFLDPVFSSGVTLALESANRAAKLVDRELRGERVDWAQEYGAYLMRGVETFRAFVLGWYTGEFPEILFSPNQNQAIREQITSVLAGYVWDESNPFVKQPARRMKQVLRIVRHVNG